MNFHDAKGILCNAEETGDTFKLGLLHYEMELSPLMALSLSSALTEFAGVKQRVSRERAWEAISAAKEDPHGGKVMLSIEDAESLLGERQ